MKKVRVTFPVSVAKDWGWGDHTQEMGQGSPWAPPCPLLSPADLCLPALWRRYSPHCTFAIGKVTSLHFCRAGGGLGDGAGSVGASRRQFSSFGGSSAATQTLVCRGRLYWHMQPCPEHGLDQQRPFLLPRLTKVLDFKISIRIY